MSDEKYVIARSHGHAIEKFREGHTYNDLAEMFPRDGCKTYKITVEEVEEEPQWWWWYCCDRKWGSIPNHRDKVGVQVADNLSGISLSVYGTTADRDAKRDALLAAAKAAGKGGEG